MKNQFTRLLIVFVAVAVMLAPFLPAFGEEKSIAQSAIATYLALYDYTLPRTVQNAMADSFDVQTVDCGDVQVSLDEVLYDGYWLYTAASAIPTDPQKTLIMPGSSQSGDLVSGVYKEKQRSDNRTFRDAAAEDEKQLLAVYIYPKEFDQKSVYFLDHLQLANHQSVLFSGGNFISTSELLPITWSIQIYDVDKTTEQYTLRKEYNIPMTIKRLSPVKQQNYTVISDQPLPFKTVIIAKTPLTVYVYPAWEKMDNQNQYEFSLLDASQKEIRPGAPPDINTFTLNQLPEELYIQLFNYETSKWEPPALLICKVDP